MQHLQGEVEWAGGEERLQLDEGGGAGELDGGEVLAPAQDSAVQEDSAAD